MTASVGAFIWATGSQMDERVRRDLPEGGFSWSYNLSEISSVVTS